MTNAMIDLEGEAHATVMELSVRQDLLDAGEADPGITGATADDKIRLWNDHRAGLLSSTELVHGLALLFARGESPSTDLSVTYWVFYARAHAAAWDAANPTAVPLPLPKCP